MSWAKEAAMSREESEKGLMEAHNSIVRRLKRPGGTEPAKLKRLAAGVAKNQADPDYPGEGKEASLRPHLLKLSATGTELQEAGQGLGRMRSGATTADRLSQRFWNMEEGAKRMGTSALNFIRSRVGGGARKVMAAPGKMVNSSRVRSMFKPQSLDPSKPPTPGA